MVGLLEVGTGFNLSVEKFSLLA